MKNHAFLDGNKRVGFMTAYIFLEVNGHTFRAPGEEVVLQTLALATGELPEEESDIWLQASCGS